MTLGQAFLGLAAVCFGGLTVVERDYAHWVWLLPMGLLLMALAALVGNIVIWKRRTTV